MPSSLALPPVEYWRGTMPSQCCKASPRAECGTVPDSGNDGCGYHGSEPGDLSYLLAFSVCGREPFELIVESCDLLLNELPLTPQHVDQVALLWRQVGFCALQNVRHGGR